MRSFPIGLFAALALAGCKAEPAAAPPALDVAATAKRAAPVVAEPIVVGEDGSITAMRDADCQPRSADPAAVALMRGEATGLPAKLLLASASRLQDCRRTRGLRIQDALLDGVGPISWDPTHDQPRLSLLPGEGMALLRGNASGKGSARRGDAVAVAGLNRRTLALASSPMRHAFRGGPLDPDLQRLLENAVAWLSEVPDEAPLTVALAHFSDSYYFPDRRAVRAWLEATYGERVAFNAAGDCDGAGLEACLDTADLLIIGSQGEVDVAAVEAALRDGLGVIYTHIDGGRTDASEALMPLLGVRNEGDNYWSHPTLVDAMPETGEARVDPVGDALLALMTGLDSGTLAPDLSACEDRRCPDDHVLTTTIAPALTAMRGRLRALDAAGAPLFEQPGRELDKTAVLLGDVFRGEARFPLDTTLDGAAPMLRTRFADHAQSVLRDRAVAFADLGNHGRTDTDVPVSPAEITLQARRTYRSAGVYARPGQAVTVTRTDETGVRTHIRVNLIRDGATHWLNRSGYTRPAMTSSADLPIAPGESLTFTSTTGGPVFVRFADIPEEGATATFHFDAVARHPVWRGPADDATFAAAVDAGDHDWAEIITDGFEVHSRSDLMQQTLGRGLSPSLIAELSARHFSDYAHALAGFTGDGVTRIADIHGWADARGIPLYNIDVVKHMNADQALCGYGCSGNPYDAYWAFDPVGHGDLHELGHGLERHRLRFEGQSGHTLTNPYSYYAKRRFQVETDGETACQSLPYRTLFDRVQQAALSADPQAAMAAHDHSGWSYGAAVNQQVMMGAQAMGLLEDGAHWLGRLHVIERAFDRLSGSDTGWADHAAALGFAGWSREDARALPRNDWLLIASSHSLGHDMSAWWERWGHAFGDRARAHVSGLPAFPLRFFPAVPTAACDGFPDASLPIDGLSEWPDDVASTPRKPGRDVHAYGRETDACRHEGAR